MSIDTLTQTKPDTSHGVPIGIGDWKLSVEMVLPTGTSTWGNATWGDGTWSGTGWVDITDKVRGLSWKRGSDEPYGRPRVGTLSVTLDSRDDYFSPWNPSRPLGSGDYFAPGGIIRVGVRSVTENNDADNRGWIPQFTGIIDTWRLSYSDANGADQFVLATAVETLRDLSEIDRVEVTPVGSGEGSIPRIQRILPSAAWPYGLLVEAQNLLVAPTTAGPVIATDLGGNPLNECYLVGDSTGFTFRSDRSGAALITNPDFIGLVGDANADIFPLYLFSTTSNGTGPFIGFAPFSLDDDAVRSYVVAPYVVDSFDSADEDHNIVNDARFTRVGGTEQRSQRSASIAKYGRRAWTRSDLVSTEDAVVLDRAADATNRGLNSLRVNSLTVDVVDRGDRIGISTIAADLQQTCFVWPPGATVDTMSTTPVISAVISGMSHRVTPRNAGGLTWEAEFSFDTRVVFNLPGAQLAAD